MAGLALAALAGSLALPFTHGLAGAARAHPGPDHNLTNHATAFLSMLDTSQRRRAVRPFDDDDRFSFTWLPGTRGGVALKAMTGDQRNALRDLLRAVLSQKGSLMVDRVMATEAALAVLENAPSYRDPAKYYIALFGSPQSGKRWALRFEGHHLSVNLTFNGDTLVSATPFFIGANPETIPAGPDKGVRAMAAQIDAAWALFEALDAKQKRLAANDNEWFGGFLTRPDQRRANLGRPAGITYAQLMPAQRRLLRTLIATHVRLTRPAFARQAMALLDQRAQRESLRFYWNGAKTRGGGSFYWRVTGKRILIEQDGMNRGRHVHGIWRDPANDFGDASRAP
ncbi:MAG: DUF3500 domain-containing protein [Pseudomonadota bacterium]